MLKDPFSCSPKYLVLHNQSISRTAIALILMRAHVSTLLGGNAAFVVMQFNPIRDRFAKEVDTEILSGQFKREHVDPAVESAAVPSE
eukprot:m.1036626 g.1036626  ORF g.1036626 m.1036626 type:complete len:87 (-) comp24139_c2_seq33:2888-3148(-)